MKAPATQAEKADPGATRVYRHGPDENEPVRFIGDLFAIKARAADTGGAYSVTEMVVSPGAAGPPEHRHKDCEEAFYVMTGELRFRVDDVETPAPSGTFLVVPRGARHTYTNPGDREARVLVLISPPGFEQYFVEMGEPEPRPDPTE